jgi:hypothetical protein
MAGRLVTFLALATVLVLATAASAAVDDTKPPTGAVGGVTSRAAGVMTLSVLAVDDGVGLSRAAAALDGITLDESPFGDGACVEAPDELAGTDCPAVSTATLEVPTAALPDGPHELTVTARDAAFNVATLVRQTITIANTPPTTTSTVTVTVGSGKIRTPSGSNPGGGGGVTGNEKDCAAPRLDVFLASKPLRIRRGTPVLVAGRKYRFRGRLTCRVDGQRKAAPRGTVVVLRSLRRGHVSATRRLKVGRRGRISVKLAFRGSRVLVFRVQGAGKDVVRVRLSIRVVRRTRAHATAAAAGGLSITPAIVEQTAGSGVTSTVTLANNSSRSLKIAATPRPWRQSRGGAVAADRRHTLGRFVRVSDDAFTLAAGARRAISVTLTRVPARRSLYGTLEVIGRPAKKRKGVNVAYRLIGSLRFNPSKANRRLRLSAGSARVRGRTLSLAVSNRGNTIDPVGGRVVVSGPRGGRSSGITGVKILPGKRIDLALLSLGGLRPGRYKAAVTLRQRGRNRVSVTRHFQIRGS